MISGVCPDSHYCEASSALPVGCPAGTYNDMTQQSACVACPAGYYCIANSTTYLSTECPAGKTDHSNDTLNYQYHEDISSIFLQNFQNNVK